MTPIHGFELERTLEIKELNSQAEVYRHLKTGARLLSILNQDENKVFGISFRTPPKDSTGVAHILEHSVLCGSRKYPVKEPFVELIKGSLQTFLNAMTYPDKTCYPVASANLQDFYNLVDVYLDAVFFPRLTPEVLMQEGWHHEVESADEPLTYKGVVFNEMKGAYSSPDGLLGKYNQESLFPDNTYGLDSGGDPAHIPDLSFEAFSDFHRSYYHPSNAWAYFYGDAPSERRLEILDAYFSQFDAAQVDSAVALQAPFEAPVQLQRGYASGDDDDAKAMCSVNIALAEGNDPDLIFALHMLEHILIGLPSSPLRKALMDSGLGEDLAGYGLEDELRQLTFSTGLKGIAAESADQVEALVLGCLGDLANKGIDPMDVEAAVNSVEFMLRENNAGSYPRGLLLMFRALNTWLHDGDPLALLPFEAPLQRIKTRLADGERLFEDLIRRCFLSNPHRSRVLLLPDPELTARRDAEESARLERERQPMDKPALEALVEQVAQLRQAQETPDSAEALATIPRLAVADLPKENKPIPLEVSERQGVPLLLHDLPTNGILYLDLGFDLKRVPDRLLPYCAILGRALLETGTRTNDFVSLSQRIARKTGGIWPQLQIGQVLNSADSSSLLLIRGKATYAMAGELLAILRDVLLDARLDNKERLRQIALEAKARKERGLVPAGHRLVATRLRARFNRAGYENELTNGASYLFFLRQLIQRIDEDFDSVAADLEELRGLLLNRASAVVNATLEAEARPTLEAGIDRLLGALPQGDAAKAERQTSSYADREGLSIPAQVNYVGKGLDIYAAGYRYSGAAHVVTRYLGTTYLWERVRVQGGAYGAFSLFDRVAGTLLFVSYRDPNLDATLQAFDGVSSFLRERQVDPEELQKSIVGAIGEIDSYMLPDAKGYMSMVRHLCGIDDAFMQRVRDQVFATTSDDFEAFAAAAQNVADRGKVVVLGAGEPLEAASAGLEIQTLL